jgi:hypothetical protein
MRDFKNAKDFRSQSAMEYLMTYGWSILVIAIAMGLLFQLGVLNPANFGPRAQPGNCKVVRIAGEANDEGTCGTLPESVAQFNGASSYVRLNNPFSTSWYFYWKHGSAKTVWAGIASSGVYSTATLPLNGWSHVCFTYSSVPGTVNVYANGAPAGSGSVSGGSTESVCVWIYPTSSTMGDFVGSQDSTTYALIGARDSSTDLFQGSVSNVQIYNTTLDANQISALYQEGIGGAPVAPQYIIGWWPLNGDANDYSGNNNNGAPTSIVFTSAWTGGYTTP